MRAARPGEEASPDDDVKLMLLVQAGDEEAFAELVRLHSTRLLRYFYVQSRDHALAEDLCQEAWARVYRARADYRPEARFLTFLLHIARNLWIDTYRAAQVRPFATALGGQGAEAQDQAATPLRGGAEQVPVDRGLERAELRRLLAEAIAALPPEMLKVFEASELLGMPYAEISEMLGIPVGTVKSRMWHAYRRLRRALGPRLDPHQGS
jgi:RNA polymerase sigma-70 factor (ECF subfamily)